jgi:hypothetical protein
LYNISEAGMQRAQPFAGAWVSPQLPFYLSPPQAGVQRAQPFAGAWGVPTFPPFPGVGMGSKTLSPSLGLFVFVLDDIGKFAYYGE